MSPVAPVRSSASRASRSRATSGRTTLATQVQLNLAQTIAPTLACHLPTAIATNVGKLGVVVKGSFTQPLRDVSLWRIRLIALWGYSTSSNPTFSDLRIADANIGLFFGAIGPSAVNHAVRLQKITLANSLLLGRSLASPSCFSQVAILLPVAGTEGYSISPSTCGPLGGHWTKGIYGMEHPTGSNPALAAEVRLTNNTIYRYGPTADTCSRSSWVMMTAMRGGMESSDAVPPIFVAQTTIDTTSRERLARLPAPKREWIEPTKCVVLDCDGPKHVLIHDLDGSLTGKGADSSVIARAEFMNERRADASKWTWYNIPTKMLYDPAPLNDPTDPGHDMSAYEARCGAIDADQFNFRRDRRSLLDRRVAELSGADDAYLQQPVSRRSLASAVESDWRQRMVFFTGDERAFYQGLDGVSCPDECSSRTDPACRTARRTHREVAYRGYGAYRDNCTLDEEGNAWHCTRPPADPALPRAWGVVPMRLIVESMDADSTSRSLTPVALASGGYVDLVRWPPALTRPPRCLGRCQAAATHPPAQVNGGWDHQRAKDCGGYGCLTRLMTFHTTVGRGRSYDLAFTGTNPQKLRLMLPHGAGHDDAKEAARVLISIFYSNPQASGRVVG